ncbi:MAG: hypothetical protein PF495_12690 [Spirochaetales bacterium]|jgi:hypothetical protein|nr:hypothetical protein [Spirochaetales bacterium]
MANGFWQGAERGTGRALQTGMGLLKYQQAKETEDARTAMMEERNDIQNAKANLEIEALNKRKAAMEQPIDITTTPQFLALPEEVRPQALDFFVKNNMTNAAGRGKTGDVLRGLDVIAKTPPIFKQFMEPVVNQKKAATLSAYEDLASAQEKGDPKKIKEATAAYQKAQMVYIATGDKYDQHLMRLEQQAAKQAAGNGPYKIGELKDFKQGDEFVQHEYTSGGTWEPTGVAAPRYKSSTNVNINTPDMSKRTQADLESEIVQGKATLDKTSRVRGLYSPEYLEYAGKGTAYLQDIGSKLGMNQGDFLKGYKQWAAEVDAHTLMWRKFITGVAGGEKEMEAIERTTINTKYDSPASFEAKLDQIERMTVAAITRSEGLLSRGFDIKKMTPEQITKEGGELAQYYEFQTPDSVRDAVNNGVLSNGSAIKILREQFGME